MKLPATAITALLLISSASAEDIAGSGDHPLVPRYPDSEICATAAEEFDQYRLVTGPATTRDKIPTTAVEGRILRNMYVLKDESRSALEVMRNYQIALQEAGFQTLFECANDDCAEGPEYKTYFFFRANPNLKMRCRVPDVADWSMPKTEPHYLAAKLSRPAEGDVTVAISVAAWNLKGGKGPRHIFVQADVIEDKPMQVGMELKLAEEMDRDIGTSGHAVLYGIQFDTDSVAIQPVSDATLGEIAKLLGSKPSLELMVVGHTDNQGALDYNLDLSKRRAIAVVEALVTRFGIARDRLQGHGVGYLAPVGSNRTNEGRALNRRVELVEQ